MARRRTKLLAAVGVLGVPLLPWVVFAILSAMHGHAPARAAVEVLGEAANEWVVGDKYAVRVNRGGHVGAYQRKLLKAAEDWIVLRDFELVRVSDQFWLTDWVPVLGNLLTRSHDELWEADQWIPREAVTIVSHWQGVNLPTIVSPLGDRPAVNADYFQLHTIRDFQRPVAGDGFIAPPNIELIVLDGEALTAASAAWNGTETFALADVFCLRGHSQPCLNPREAE